MNRLATALCFMFTAFAFQNCSGSNFAQSLAIGSVTATSVAPDSDCFLWASGFYPSDANNASLLHAMIGDTSLTVLGASGLMGSEYVGGGSYSSNAAALPLALAGRWNGIAIGAKTRLVVYSQPNYQGYKVLDQQGPRLIFNAGVDDASFNQTFSVLAWQGLFPLSDRLKMPFDLKDAAGTGSTLVQCE